jgi:hypothetical protein
MSKIVQVLLGPTGGPRSVLLVRIAVGLIFFTQGLLKYIDPNMGVVRFTRIGFPHPYFTAHFVGAFEFLWPSAPSWTISSLSTSSWRGGFRGHEGRLTT